MTRLALYPSYRDSGLPWLGHIPAHWEVKRIKFVAPASAVKIVDKPEDLPYVGLENIESSTGRLLMETQPETVESTVGIFEEGDILFGKLRPYLAKVAYANFCGSCTTEILALRPKAEIDGRFLYFFLLSSRFIDTVNSMTYGTKMPRASREQIGNLALSLPPLPEQRTIATFLDRQTAKIDVLIAKKQRLLDLLAEKRAALISRAVTKGLNPAIEMKDSGLPWLGHIPAHWEVTKVKRGYDIRLGKMLRPEPLTSSDTLEPYLRAANIQWQDVTTDNVKEMWFSQWEKPLYELQAGDLMVCEGGDVGRAAVWQGQLEKCYIQNSVHRVRSKKNFINKFLYYWLVTLKNNGYIDLLCNKATIAHFTAEKFAAIELIAPPLPEQRLIAAYLDRQTAKIDALATKVESAIERLREYRSALISSVVTGKIDVREMNL